MRIAKTTNLTAAVILFAAGPAFCAPPPAEAEPEKPAANKRSLVEIPETLIATNPRLFSQRLGELLGAEVRLPRDVPRTLTVKAGKLSSTELLNGLAERMDGSWRISFVYRREVKNKPQPESKLESVGSAIVALVHRSFDRGARSIAEPAGCRVEFSEAIPGGRYSLAYREEVPVERALKDLGARARMTVSPVVVFELPEKDPQAALERQMRDEQERLNEQQLTRNELASWLHETYGADPNSEEFPWDSLQFEAIAPTITFRLDLSYGEAELVFNQVRQDALARIEQDRVPQAPPGS